MINDLHKTAEQNERNRDRYHVWRQRYFKRFAVWPDGNLRRHRRCCVIQEWRRYWNMMTTY